MRQSWLSPLAVTRSAGPKGKGIFAGRRDPRGHHGGRLWRARRHRTELDGLDDEIRIHALQIDDDLFIASVPPFDDADYVNHSCEPNCGIVGSVLLVTMREVAAGEELRFDYAMTDSDDYDEFDCSCGTPTCRRVVSGADWKDPELPTAMPGLVLGLPGAPDLLTGGPHVRAAPEYRRPSWTRAIIRRGGRPARRRSPARRGRAVHRRARASRARRRRVVRHASTLSRRVVPSPPSTLAPRLLFEREGFVGNIDRYDDPENSFLDAVIERRLGIPITLSVLMMAVGRRLGVDVQGVGMPGHFLVLDGARGDMWCDPFHRGAVLDAAGARRRFDLVYGGAMAFQPGFLAPTSPHTILARMLANLERGRLAADPVQRAWMCRAAPRDPGRPVRRAGAAGRPARDHRRRDPRRLGVRQLALAATGDASGAARGRVPARCAQGMN